MKYKTNIKGKASTWFILLVLVVGGVVGFKIATVHFHKASVESFVDESAERYLLEGGYDLKGNIIRSAAEYGIVIKPKDIKYKKSADGNQVKVSFYYTEYVDLHFKNIPYKNFITVTKDMARERNVLNKFQKDLEENIKKGADRKWQDSNNQ